MLKSKYELICNLDVMAFTTKNIISKKNSFLSVWHDLEDGMWQFLDGTDVKDEDAAIISMGEIIELDLSVHDVLECLISSYLKVKRDCIQLS